MLQNAANMTLHLTYYIVHSFLIVRLSGLITSSVSAQIGRRLSYDLLLRV
jgi:hypothetical protein